ncbi:hypothetical protein WA171_001007 [Blastocystis sp. BT1]
MQCSICCDKIDVRAVLPCNHNTCCGICIFKEIALFKNRRCPYCKEDIRTPILTVIPRKKYNDLQQEYRFKHNKEYDIDFDNAIVEKWFLDLLLMRCVVCDPVIPFGKVNEQEYGKQTIVDYGTVATLRAHLNEEHHKSICQLCASQGRMFPYELKLYFQPGLQSHLNGIAKDPSQPIHVQCPVCGIIQYDSHEVLIHCRSKHIHCFLCGINDPKNYYLSEKKLFEHYGSAHFLCHMCKKYVGETMMDLINHQNKEHGGVDPNNHLYYENPAKESLGSFQSTRPQLSAVTRPQLSAVTRPQLPQHSVVPHSQPPTQHSSVSRSPSVQRSQSRLVASSAPFVQRQPAKSFLSFTSFREDLVNLFSILVDVPTNIPAAKHDAYEMCKVLLELCTNIVDYLALSPSSLRLSFTDTSRTILLQYIEKKRHDINVHQLVAVGVTRDHAERIHRYIHQYRTAKGWGYYYHEGSSDFSKYSEKELWTISCFLYLTIKQWI